MKKIICMTLAAALTLGTSSQVLAAGNTKKKAPGKPKIVKNVKTNKPVVKTKETVKVTTKVVKYKKGYVNIDFKIPVISGLKDKKVEKSINDKIYNQAMTLKTVIEKSAKEMEPEYKKNKSPMPTFAAQITYAIHENKGNVLSLTLDEYSYEGGAHGIVDRVCYNIDLNTGKEIKLADLFNKGVDYKGIISKEIKKQVQANKDKYFEEARFEEQDIKWNQNFYIDKGNVIVYYQVYEIAPYAVGIPQFKINMPKGVLKSNIAISQDPISVKNKEGIYDSNKKISEDVKYPVFSGIANKKLQDKINKDVEQEVLKVKAQMEKEALEYYNKLSKEDQQNYTEPRYELKVDYDITEASNGILSFHVDYYEYSAGANGFTERKYYNVDLKSGKYLEIKDLFKKGVDYKKAINAEIKKQIAKTPEKYFHDENGFNGITDKQNFYIYNGNIVIEFGKYEIAPGSTGVPKFVMQSSQFKNILK